MTDNFELLKSLLDFSGGNYIHLIVVRRLKDNPGEMLHTSILDYYFGARDMFEVEYPNIRVKADEMNARIYLCLNPEALSEEFKAQIRKSGSLFGDKAVYGLSENSIRYLLYDADKGEETRSAEIWEQAVTAGLAVARIPTVTGEGFILLDCDYPHVFGQRAHFYPQCFALLYYH